MSSEIPDALRHLRRLVDPQSRAVTDADLIERFVLHHDQAAFELLLWRHAGMVMGVCRAVLRDHHLAEDAFQATFLALARKAGSIGRREVVAGWLYRVAHNAALKSRQSQVRRATQSLEHDPAAPEVSDDVGPVLHEELSRLPERYRLPLVLCFLEGQSHTDAAKLLGWPKGTVAGRVARARDVLRQRLERRGVALSVAALTPVAASALSPALVAATVQASVSFAAGNVAGIAVPVHRLAEGVLHTMFVAKVKAVAVLLLLVGCLLGGLGTLAVAQKPVEKKAPPAASTPKATLAQKMHSINNLKQLGLAVHNYLSVHDKLPGNVLDQDGKPLLSWRVLMLPYLEQDALYKQFKLDEPWDSKHNRALLSKMPEVFRHGLEAKDATDTVYQGFAGDDTMFPARGGLKLADVTDGLSNTILLLEAGEGVPWTKPVDLPYAAGKPLPKLGGPFKDVIHTVFADGAVMAMKRDFDEKLLRLAITRNDGEVLDVHKLRAYELPRRKPDPDPDLNPLDAARLLAERAKAEADAMARHAVEIRVEAEKLKQENVKLKEALRDIVLRLEKLDKKPAADDLKGLTAEFERLQTELRQLRDRIKRLEKSDER